uniref:Uncharacterized protein n=1 Tax=Nelumbo nucifera TaxID=4432 RepID=A0A822XYJ3_NELNU|nr:TPA_asm: hypothetical protein HUJ06_025642 [Nelumbo nucifera]
MKKASFNLSLIVFSLAILFGLFLSSTEAFNCYSDDQCKGKCDPSCPDVICLDTVCVCICHESAQANDRTAVPKANVNPVQGLQAQATP